MGYLMRKRSRKWRGFFLLAFLPVLLPAQTPNGKAIQERYQRAEVAGQNEIAEKEFCDRKHKMATLAALCFRFPFLPRCTLGMQSVGF